MTKQEFEARTNRIVTESEFDYINNLYMSAGNISKDDFCQAWMALAGPKKNVLLDAFVEHCEQLARTVDNYQRVINDQATQLDAARTNMSNMQKEINRLKAQIELRDEKIMQMQTVQDAVEAHIDLEDEKEVREAFEKAYGKLYTIRSRFENNWDLNDDEILWLIQHAEE